MERHDSTEEFGLRSFLRVLRQRVGVIVLCLLVAPGSALAFSLLQEEQYSASAKLLFRDPALDQKLFGSSFTAPSTDPARQAATNVRLVSLDAVAQRTAEALGHGLTGDTVAGRVDVEAEGQSDVVAVTATDRNPRFAAQLANTFATQYVSFRRDADRSKVSEAERLVQDQLASLTREQSAGPEGRSLRQRADQLRILASLQTGNAELVQRADTPESPSTPKVARNLILGGLAGLLLGIGLAFIRERLDRRIRDPEELEEAFGLPVLATVPESKALGGAETGSLPPPREAEQFATLRSRLRYFNVDRSIRSVVVTSAASGDGKTTVAWNLAVAAASTRASRVVLVEADLRHPSIAQQHGLPPTPGLSEMLTQGAVEALQQVTIRPWSGKGVPLDVIVAGAVPPNPLDLVESDKMAQLLESLQRAYDLVIIDTPPTPLVSDALPLITRADGVIVVAWLGRTTRDSARKLREQLDKLDGHLLGVVANHTRAGAEAYGSYYYRPQIPENGNGAAPSVESKSRPLSLRS